MFNCKQYIQVLRWILKDAAEKSIWNLCHKEKGFGLENRKRHTVLKMGLILHSIERMLKMQFSLARKFTLQPLRSYDVKPPEKTAQV
jgi:hypothetical protein